MVVKIFDGIETVYHCLQDEESKRIFQLRGLYSLTGEIAYFDQYLKELPERNLLENSTSEKAYIFGCGCFGKIVHQTLHKNWRGFVDNNSDLWGGTLQELKIMNPQELSKDAIVYLAVKWHHEEIKQQLLSYGIPEDNIINVGKILIDMSNRQYFDLPILRHDENEVFVDVGCLNGETSENFIEWANGKYQHIYCFEADPHNAVDCKQNLDELIQTGKVSVINKAVADKKGMVSFCSLQNGNSKIGDGNVTVEAMTLDEFFSDKKITFLKMDIEGAEYRALMGAENIIREQHPKLAISVYHLPSDIYDIPALILSYYPGYRFYLRHYSPFEYETTLYAV